MTTLRTAAFAAALLVSGAALQPSMAMPVANVAGLVAGEAAPSAFMLDGGFAPGRIDRIDAETAQAAAADYFDFDAVITLGALALAGAAMAALAIAAARRNDREAAGAEPAWRESVFRAVQADLATFAESHRRAA